MRKPAKRIRKQKVLTLHQETIIMLDELAEHFGKWPSHVVDLAIARLHEEEIPEE